MGSNEYACDTVAVYWAVTYMATKVQTYNVQHYCETQTDIYESI